MKTKKYILILCLVFMLFGCDAKKVHNPTLRIVYGMKTKQLLSIKKHYDVMVINAAKVSRQDLTQLHKKAKYIYSYLDIAALNPKSPAFKKLKSLKLMPTVSGKKYYMNVADKKWQNYLTKTVKSYEEKGIDGYFIDHSDLYEKRQNNTIYAGLKTILSSLKKTKSPLILNNAQALVEKDPKILKGIAMISQEDVFTYWNHQTNKRADVPEKESLKKKNYLKKMAAMHKHVYVIDFTKKSDWQAVIKAYDKKYGYSTLFPLKTNYSK